jgi:hypothetical protein
VTRWADRARPVLRYPAMRWRFPTLVLLYVTLDFANPLMPGAVSFEAGSIEVVQGDRTARTARPAALAARLVTVFPGWSVVPIDATLGRPAQFPWRPSTGAPRAARRMPQHFPAAPSPSEDH